MISFPKLPLWIIGLFIFSGKICAQSTSFQATNIRSALQNNVLTITYDLPVSGANQFYNVHFRIVDSTTHLISVPRSVSGDYGTAITGGTGKTLRWDCGKDTVMLSQKYGIVAMVTVSEVYGGASNAWKSLLVPGLGDYYVYGKKGNGGIVFTVLSYGCIGYGIYNLTLSKATYSKYEEAIHQSDIDQYFGAAQNQQTVGQLFIAAGAAFWVADIIRVAAKGAQNDRYRSGKIAKLNLGFSGQGINLTYKF